MSPPLDEHFTKTAALDNPLQLHTSPTTTSTFHFHPPHGSLAPSIQEARSVKFIFNFNHYCRQHGRGTTLLHERNNCLEHHLNHSNSRRQIPTPQPTWTRHTRGLSFVFLHRYILHLPHGDRHDTLVHYNDGCFIHTNCSDQFDHFWDRSRMLFFDFILQGWKRGGHEKRCSDKQGYGQAISHC